MKTSTIFLFLFVLGSAQDVLHRKSTDNKEASNLTSFHYPYIIGGEVVKGREFPGQVSLQLRGKHDCGGSIVNKNYILTAAHCSHYDVSEMSVLSGTNSLVKGGTKHKVIAIHMHEKYDPEDSWHHDIAVMKVDPPFVFGEGTKPVTLPSRGQSTPEGSNTTVIGWGLTEDGMVSNDLQKVIIQIFNHDECKEIYKKDGFNIYREQICANTAEGHKGSCSGDSGGPLFVNGQVIGLVSWAQGCSLKEWPTVNTEISFYIDWINSKINS